MWVEESILNGYNLNFHVKVTKPASSPHVFNAETNQVEPNLESQTRFDKRGFKWIRCC